MREARSWTHLLSDEFARLPESTCLGRRSPYCSVNVLMQKFTNPQATILFDDMPKAIEALRNNSHLLTLLRPHIDTPWMPVSVASQNKPMQTHGTYCVLVYRLWKFEQLLSSTSTLNDEEKRVVFRWRGAHAPLMLYCQHKKMYKDEDLRLYADDLFDCPQDKFAPNPGVGIFSADNCLPLLSTRMWNVAKCMFPHIQIPKGTGDVDAGSLFWDVASKLLPGRCLRRGTASLIVTKWEMLYHLIRWAVAILLLNGYGDSNVNCNLLKQQEVICFVLYFVNR